MTETDAFGVEVPVKNAAPHVLGRDTMSVSHALEEDISYATSVMEMENLYAMSVMEKEIKLSPALIVAGQEKLKSKLNGGAVSDYDFRETNKWSPFFLTHRSFFICDIWSAFIA